MNYEIRDIPLRKAASIPFWEIAQKVKMLESGKVLFVSTPNGHTPKSLQIVLINGLAYLGYPIRTSRSETGVSIWGKS